MVSRRQFLWGDFKSRQAPQRPPWALAEALFINACSRCGDCVPVCPTRIIVIVRGFPEVDFKRGECTFCGACAAACKDKALLDSETQIWPWAIKAQVASSPACRIEGSNAASAAITARWPRSASARALAGRQRRKWIPQPATAAVPASRPARRRRSAWSEACGDSRRRRSHADLAPVKPAYLMLPMKRFSTSADASTWATWQVVQTWRDASKALVAATKWLSPSFGEFFFT